MKFNAKKSRITFKRHSILFNTFVTAAAFTLVYWLTTRVYASEGELNDSQMDLDTLFNSGYWPKSHKIIKLKKSSIGSPRLSYLETPHDQPIPRIIHQSWKTSVLPDKFLKWHESWIRFHPGWKHFLWTDKDNLRLVQNDFPWFLEKYTNLSSGIKRADAARFLYMYKYGGFYADLDVECLKSHESLRNIGGIILPLMDGTQDFKWNHHNIPNAWLASPPNHFFWIFALSNIMAVNDDEEITPEDLTGPVALMRAAKLYDTMASHEKSPPIRFMAPGLVFPYSWFDLNSWEPCATRAEGFDPIACQKKVDPDGNAFSITYWSHSWADDGLQSVE